jgi:shikimate kinase
MNIILIGYRACGKTSMGKLLAEQLWKTFKDVDDETCKLFRNHSIADIWREHGEPAWREKEVQVTQKLCASQDMVIALGGGTLMQPAARQAVEASTGVRIYLKCKPEELHRRIHSDTRSSHTRPSLTATGGDLEEIKAVLAVREPVYEAVADKVFDVTHTPVADAVSYVIHRCL